MTRIVIMGGGPAGYEAALVAAQHGSDVTIVEQEGMGGACVLHDCVPSKTFISSAGIRVDLHRAPELGLTAGPDSVGVDLPVVNARVKGLALAQSADVRARVEREGVRIVRGSACFTDEPAARAPHVVEARGADGVREILPADVVLIATGATPRVLPDARPDGERILTWRDLYDLPELPEHLVVIGSGVTGAEFVSAYVEIGVRVTLVSSRDRVLPGEDADASAVLQDVFAERGVEILGQARADSVKRDDSLFDGRGGVVVTLADGRTITGSHALMTVGSVPNTADLALEKVGVETDRGGFIPVDRVSRTSVPGVYAAGDCTGLLMLASVAAMQGRIAMWHALGEGVAPIKLKTVASAVFTRPEIATVGISQRAIDAGEVPARTIMLPLSTNPRAKMQGLRRGFVKLFCRPATGVVVGGVVVAPVASELILPIALAVQNGLTVDDLAYTFSVYPSLSGSITEAGRQLMRHGDLD
ncbi:NAD(P)H-quinone dehydrogenase [Pseudonocardia sp. KRD-184]|uniref:NAD(P)H-quinone dehydrogenase n=1 Tax=Pseudonocardia oceani TaxID=2792013 RepID=A0ABS6U6H5_9PSEU|nr:NAD(P)H-quinone dehydrogenase [Pseudonocardia oceani]MBW0092259.1 NAD(P)H-quinone dehydrogenase [Pseudonocardia oceani]MBW0098081.1 NAD(P)H-quinone dehydrogenase [Pseudonocardia oceani]MBW0111200.1 NAD(P)H-quinone dehydrogenase [Pseudonocardia oceani]MBW0125081.1 NAD(P)H-quinone dehydrogenase [Pseudonocardia oceani]MBW0127840.1 NAD(P)H-quinone dehydrogenase [Pseudonocardia oceani]